MRTILSRSRKGRGPLRESQGRRWAHGRALDEGPFCRGGGVSVRCMIPHCKATVKGLHHPHCLRLPMLLGKRWPKGLDQAALSRPAGPSRGGCALGLAEPGFPGILLRISVLNRKRLRPTDLRWLRPAPLSPVSGRGCDPWERNTAALPLQPRPPGQRPPASTRSSRIRRDCPASPSSPGQWPPRDTGRGCHAAAPSPHIPHRSRRRPQGQRLTDRRRRAPGSGT